MSDVSGIEISDVLGLSDPITKLIETISGGIGKLYEPTHIRRMAKARAKEIQLLSETISSIDSLPIKYDTSTVIIDGMDYSELAKRAQGRLAFQELKKQNNIDRVVGYAAEELSGEERVTSQPVDTDWVTRFFDSVADVSSDEMQQIWGKILAGEVNNPGRFSLRTLEAVRNMSQNDAELFVTIAPFLVSFNSEMLISSNTDLLSKYNLSYGIIMALDECGLVNSSGTLSINVQLTKKQPQPMYSSERVALLQSVSEESDKISFGIHTLTRAGKELCTILSVKPNNDYFIDFAKQIESANKGRVSISVHAVNEIIDERINYQEEPIEVIKSIT